MVFAEDKAPLGLFEITSTDGFDRCSRGEGGMPLSGRTLEQASKQASTQSATSVVKGRAVHGFQCSIAASSGGRSSVSMRMPSANGCRSGSDRQDLTKPRG